MPARKDHSFGDTGHYQAIQKIKERFNKLLTDLQKTVERSPQAVQTVQRFRGCIEVTGLVDQDASRLPFYSQGVYSPKPNKIGCVLCLLSYTVQLYWRFCAGNKLLQSTVEDNLHDLEQIAIKRLEAFKISKSAHFGAYFLKEIKKSLK